MKENIERVDWAVSFSQKDLKELREGDWLNLKDELYSFLYGLDPKQHLTDKRNRQGGIKLISISKPEFIRNTSAADVEGIKKDLSKFLRLLTTGTGLVYPGIKTREAHIIFGSSGLTSPFDWYIYVESDRVAAQVMLGHYFISSGITREQIRTCPECTRRFLIKRKPRSDRTFYCSPRCTSTASSRIQRKRKSGHLKVVQRGRGTDRLETGSRGKRSA